MNVYSADMQFLLWEKLGHEPSLYWKHIFVYFINVLTAQALFFYDKQP